MLRDRPNLTVVPPDARYRPFRTKSFVAGAVVVAVIIALLGWLLFAGTSSHHTTTPPTKIPKVASTHPATTTRSPAAATSGCHLSDRDQTVPKTAPPVTWSIFQTVALPYSKTAGPAHVDGDVARCYAHTPTGALIADIQISTRYLVSVDWRDVVAQQVVPGPGVKVYKTERPTVSSTAAPGDYCQVAGYSVLDYTPAKAALEIVSRCGANLQATTSTVDWSGTDWRLVLQPNGGESRVATQVANLVGFTVFGGV